MFRALQIKMYVNLWYLSMPIRVDHDERRRLVGEVVAGIIASKGLEAVTVRAVAEASGFSTRVVSHYFAGKREVLLLCYRQTAMRAGDRFEVAVTLGKGDLMTALDALLPLHPQAREDWLVWVSFWGMAIGDPEFSAIQRLQFQASRERFAALLSASSVVKLGVLQAARDLLAALSGMAVQAAFDPADWPATRQRDYMRQAVAAALTAVESGN